MFAKPPIVPCYKKSAHYPLDNLSHFVLPLVAVARSPAGNGAMEPSVPDVTDKELEVLQIIWEHGPSPIRPLAERLYGDAAAASYATVQKLLERLEAKDLVARDRSAMTHVFSARINREAFIGGRLRAMADKLCGGSLTPVLTHLLQTEKLSAPERKALRKLLNPSD